MDHGLSTTAQHPMDNEKGVQPHFELKPISAFTQNNAAHCYLAHQHGFYQLIWFKKAGRHYVDYETVDHPDNAIFFINKNQVHNFCESAPNEGYMFQFNDLFIHRQNHESDSWLRYKLFNEIGSPYVVPQDYELLAIENLSHCLLVELDDQEYNFEQQIYYLFRTILLKVERLKHAQHPDLPETDPHLSLVIQFKQLIDQNITRNLSIDEFATELGTSSKSLTAYSKKYLQSTPATLIQNRKVLEAKRLLSNHQLTIQEVAYRLGFEQPTYFTKYFKKSTGLTPKEFTRHIANSPVF